MDNDRDAVLRAAAETLALAVFNFLQQINQAAANLQGTVQQIQAGETSDHDCLQCCKPSAGPGWRSAACHGLFPPVDLDLGAQEQGPLAVDV